MPGQTLSSPQKAQEGVYRTVCGLCNGNCGISVAVENGRVVHVEGRKNHPVTRGYICPKGRAVKELLEAPDRLRRPLKKTAGGRWQEISWEEALHLIAQKLNDIKAGYGAEAVAVHVGQAGVRKESTLYAKRFCRAFGTPNFSTAGSHCHISKMMANMVTCGVLPVSDYRNSNCIVLWGYNPAASCPPLLDPINEALRRGAGLIVVDPRVTPLAKRAGCHLQLRPGTDCALALSMLHVIIEEGLYDRDFVGRWTAGFDRLAKHAAGYPPEKVAQVTWVPAEKIKEAARLYAKSSPACISTGIAVELNTNGFQAARAIAILQAVTGNLDVRGGALFVPEAKLASLKLDDIDRGSFKPAVGQDEFPLFYKYTRQAQANIYTEAILEGKPYPLKGMVIAGSNPVLTWPNAGRVKSALASLEFLAVVDHFMTETAALADVVLPAAAFPGRNELWSIAHVYGLPVIGLAPAVLEEEGVMTDWVFWKELAGRMGYDEYFPFKSEEDAINFRLEPLEMTVEDLKQEPSGHAYAKWKEKKYERRGFKTPSGKVEIYSEELEKYGYDPLPVYREADAQGSSGYPLVLTTGARTIGYIHSRFRNLPSLRRLSPEPLVEVHKDKARELGVEEGETVVVETLNGSVEVRVKIVDQADPRVIFIPHGWSGANANILTGNDVLDPVTGFPACRSVPARIVKIK
ncbi:MAG: molybdopterin-dependent oxidoreductase [Pelotomaculum sp.]|uniref:Anaerobic dehydrogenases n=1 Tax=Pelotomaculum thermopropionicum (strain DSM 13744 / JCM 10971 / SI) TaxID=370438 RepID=A5D4T7_PELTS|nr:molybdopterin-dependent oxidoreductase [Pelotomaculum sp.]BAF58760.1 anaerobic dehydrogenases [Pelotomaculum thermopropionicum SI]